MKAEAAEKTIELNLTDIGGLFYAKRLQERHRELLHKLRQQYGKPKKSVKIARKAWKDDDENFSKELLRMREE
ncbi:MAG: hypothetical protein NUV74_03320 [Candidatus Brocadiaceae bacterium]|nr:hypothetical protein [Candidatus Brocadiaceae bacterium]